MTSTTNQNQQVIDALIKPGQKVTILTLGAMGASKTIAVTRGMIQTPDGERLSFSAPRSPKRMAFDVILDRGCIILKGHVTRPLIEGDVEIREPGSNFSTRMFVMGSGPRLSSENGKYEVMEFIRDNLLIHTIDRCKTLDYVLGGRRDPIPESILHELMAMLPPAPSFGVPAPVVKKRHQFLTDNELQKLRKAEGKKDQPPIFKVFNPDGCQTWLLCSLEDDMDTFWGFADLGMDCVEFGTISRKELEEVTGRFGLHIEKDKGFKKCGYTTRELLSMNSLPTCLEKPKEVHA